MRRSCCLLALMLAGLPGTSPAQVAFEPSEEELAVLQPYAAMSQDVRRRLAEGKPEEAHRRVEDELREIEEARTATPDDPILAARLAWTLTEQLQLVLQTDEPGVVAGVCEAILDRQRELARAFPSNFFVVNRFLISHDIAIRSLLPRDPDTAERFFPSYRAALNDSPTDDEPWRAMVEKNEKFYSFRLNDLDRIRFQGSLIGTPAPALPLLGDWVNGPPLAEGDLDGKVVLLDFWAVYCVPCIAAFPELRRWHEEYADRGLVIVGVTGCFGYDWDEESRQSLQVDGLPKEDELRAFERFASHHGLAYRFLAEPEDFPVHQAYKVNSIPQTVLIDREGNVRLIEEGSSEESLRKVEQAIIKVIEQP